MLSLQEKGHIEVLDIAKGLAMLMTIFCHALQRATPENCGTYLVWRLVHEWHMPMFMIISGYLAARSSRMGSAAYVRDKFFRLMYPWFIWRWLEWAFMRVPFSGLLPFNDYVPTSFLGNLLYFIRQPFRPMWFLIDLFLFMLILCACKRISGGSERRMGVLLAACVAGSLGLYYFLRAWWISNRDPDSWGLLFYDIQYFGLFILGYSFAKLTDLEISRGGSGWLCACVICAVGGLLVILCKEYFTPRFCRIQLFWGKAIVDCALILMGLMVLLRIPALKRPLNGLAYMGKHSLEYYTLQFICLDCGWFLWDTNLRWFVNFAACMVICTVVTMVTSKRLPGLHKLLWGDFSFQNRREAGKVEAGR